MRSAWIEIVKAHGLDAVRASRSMRSAWIEITHRPQKNQLSHVALHAERVD